VVSADSYPISRAGYYSGYRSAALLFAYRTFTFCGSTFLNDSAKHYSLKCGPTTPSSKLDGLGFSNFARHYFRNNFFSLPYLDVSVRAVPSRAPMYSARRIKGFPIRTSPDIMSDHDSPRLIAVIRVLHRQPTPRHPPCTLSSFFT
jgi:hypothetical protein